MNLTPIRANMNVLHINGIDILFSYRTPVAAVIDGCAYRTEKKWSNTTTRHINQWLPKDVTSIVDVRPQEFFDKLISEGK